MDGAAQVQWGQVGAHSGEKSQLQPPRGALRKDDTEIECLDHFVIFGERHLRSCIKQFIEHYLTERFHQGIGSQIIMPETTSSNDNATRGPIECRSRLGGLLNYYHRKAA